MRLPDPSEVKQHVGMVLLDPVTAATHPTAPEAPPTAVVSPGSGVSLDHKHLIYWSWSDYGSAWSSTPRVFRIGDGDISGFLARESSGGQRIYVHRIRPRGGGFRPIPVGEGSNTYPVVSEDGRFLVLIVSEPGKPE